MINITTVEAVSGLKAEQDWSISFTFNHRERIVVAVVAERVVDYDGKNICGRTPDAVTYGVSFCSDKDAYDNVKGMRIALQRALHNTPNFPCKDFYRVWDEWLKRYIGKASTLRSGPMKERTYTGLDVPTKGNFPIDAQWAEVLPPVEEGESPATSAMT